MPLLELLILATQKKVKLIDFIDAIENELKIKANRNFMPIQKGDVTKTWANASLLKELTGYKPKTEIKEGISNFISWYRDYYNV